MRHTCCRWWRETSSKTAGKLVNKLDFTSKICLIAKTTALRFWSPKIPKQTWWKIDADEQTLDEDLGFSSTKVCCYESSQYPPMQISPHQTVDKTEDNGELQRLAVWQPAKPLTSSLPLCQFRRFKGTDHQNVLLLEKDRTFQCSLECSRKT
jgi:glucose-6-phosphate dehydrogenase assembly protein OpcA